MFWVVIRLFLTHVNTAIFLFMSSKSIKLFPVTDTHTQTHSFLKRTMKSVSIFCLYPVKMVTCWIKQRLKTYVTFPLRLFGEDVASAAEQKVKHRSSFIKPHIEFTFWSLWSCSGRTDPGRHRGFKKHNRKWKQTHHLHIFCLAQIQIYILFILD